jgi:hypothetical protein
MASRPVINVMRMPERAVSLVVTKSEIMPLTTGPGRNARPVRIELKPGDALHAERCGTGTRGCREHHDHGQVRAGNSPAAIALRSPRLRMPSA